MIMLLPELQRVLNIWKVVDDMALKYRSIEFHIEPGTGQLIPEKKLTKLEENFLVLGNIIYIYKGERDMYVGQTKNFYKRHAQHCAEKELKTKARTTKYVDGSYDKVIVAFNDKLITQTSLDDIERKFITYVTADNETTGITVNNHTEGNYSVAYENQDMVISDFIIPFWKELFEKGYVHNERLDTVKNSILFKYSPFFSLSDEQQNVISSIIANDTNSIVYGLAGTGKTVLITNLAIKYAQLYPDARIAIVSQSNWVESGKKIFKAYDAENVDVDTALVIYRNNIHYDLILVDESHRLRRYYSKTNHIRDDIFELYEDPDTHIKKPKYNELDQLIRMSKQIVLFYDPLQSVKPTDIQPDEFTKIIEENNFKTFRLNKEYRVSINDKDKRFTGDDYINGLLSVLQLNSEKDHPFNKALFSEYIENREDAYFGIVNSIAELFDYLDNMEAFSSQTTNRVVAGYTRPWVSQKDKSRFDWVEGDHQWKWNSTNKNWINRPNSRSEIGCIHSVQGVDLNYVGVIISNDIEIIDGELHGNINNYKDENGKFSKADFSQKGFDDYIKNIYYVLMSRGISGIRVYFEDKKMERYFKQFMEIEESR